MPVTVPASWSGAQALAWTVTPQNPPTQSLAVPVANTAGDWMIAAAGWRQQTAAAGVSCCAGDDIHNWWDPAGMPAADSPAAGVTRCAVWAAPAARAATQVLAAPTGFAQSVAMIVLDVAGMVPWLKLGPFASGYANSASGLTLATTGPAAQVLLIAALATDNLADVITGPGAGWTSLTPVTASNGSDHTADLQLNVAWMVTTVAQAAAWSSSGLLDLAGVVAAFTVAPAAPVAPNPNWPIMITEAAPGAGVRTPPAQLGWQALSARALKLDITQGQPYILGGLQAGQGTLTLDDPDAELIPPGQGPYAGIDSGTPVRVRAILPSSATPHWAVFGGFLQQLPSSLDPDLLRGVMASTITDAFAYCTRSLPPVLRQEILYDKPYACWPLADPAGSTTASNIAPGNVNPLTLTLSKYGSGGSTAAFGTNTGALKGDSGSGMFQIGGVPVSNPNAQGWSLACTDGNFPGFAGGITAEGWFNVTSIPVQGNLLTLGATAGGGVLQIGADVAGLFLGGTGSGTNFASVAAGPVPPGMFHVAVACNRSTYTVYVNGAVAAAGSWGFQLLPRFTQVWVNGALAPSFVLSGVDSYYAGIAITPGLLPQARVNAHYQAGSAACAGEVAHQRIERILAAAGVTGRRVILPDTTPDLTRMASMATIGGAAQGIIAPGQPGYTPPSGTQASAALQGMAASAVPGLFTVAPTGDLFWLAKQYAYNQPARWVLGDSTAGGETPFTVAIVHGYDPSLVKNDISVTQPDSGTAIAPSVVAAETASQNQYGVQSYSAAGYLQFAITAQFTTVSGLLDLANWIAGAAAAPHLRVSQVTVDASRRPAAWPFVLGAAPGDMVQVNLRPPTMPGVTIALLGRLTQIQRQAAFALDGVAGAVTCALDYAPEQNILTADDSVRGQLTGANVLGW